MLAQSLFLKMESADKIEKAPSNPIEPEISVKEEDQNENSFFIRDTGPYDVNEQTLSEIEQDIADLEVARKLIKKKAEKEARRIAAIFNPYNRYGRGHK